MDAYIRGEEKFVNPYHFVPLGQKCDRNYNYGEIKGRNDLLTGWIECELETKSPVFIPNSSNNHVFQKEAENDKMKSYDFFSREDLSGRVDPPAPTYPVIPGSELRGVFRSAFEAVTNSCMSIADNDSVFFKRTVVPGKPGKVIKENGKWFFCPCEKTIKVPAGKKYENDDKCRNGIDLTDEISEEAGVFEGDLLCFEGKGKIATKIIQAKTEELGEDKKENIESGYLHKGEYYQEKYNERIFLFSEKEKKEKICEEAIENLLVNYRLYSDKKIDHDENKKHGGYRNFLDSINKKYKRDFKIEDLSVDHMNGALVYGKSVEYQCGKKKIYLSPAAIGREVFYNRLRNLIKSYTPCVSSQELCPACALFGFVAEKDSVAGRIRFSDAEFSPSERAPSPLFLEPVVLPELSSPKPSATEFYLKKPDGDAAAVWNYDYVRDKNKKERLYLAQIQGRKFYWHWKSKQKAGNVVFPVVSPVSERNVKVRPLAAGVIFTFKVYFNDVTKDELKKLLWVLTVGNSEKHGHKLGMGKPVGLGSISVRAKNVILRSLLIQGGIVEYEINCEREQRPDFIDSVTMSDANDKKNVEQACKILGGDLTSVEAFLKLSKFDNGFGDIIDYPRLDSSSVCNEEDDEKNKNSIFHWFVGNRKITKKVKNKKGHIEEKVMSNVIDQELPSIKTPFLLKIIRKEAEGESGKQ